MNTTKTPEVYKELGVKRVINAMGSATLLGGSILTGKMQAAMEEANECFVDMEDLLDKSGKALSELLGAEAAMVTSGCFAALVLGAAAIITGKDKEKVDRLLATTGMKNEFLIQKGMRYHFDRCVSVAGGKLVEVGEEHGTTAEQLEAAIGPATAGILYLAHVEGPEGILSLPEVVGIAGRKGVAVLLDAAFEVYPLERMREVITSGADLVCFGGKYFGSANSTGVLCGRKEMVEAATLNNFISFEKDNRGLGRGYKVDRQEVICTVVALKEWFTMNHEERYSVEERHLETIAKGLAGIPHVKTQSVWIGGKYREPWKNLRIDLDEATQGKTAASIGETLREDDPSIWVRVNGNQIYVAPHTLREGEDKVIAERLRQLLTQ